MKRAALVLLLVLEVALGRFLEGEVYAPVSEEEKGEAEATRGEGQPSPAGVEDAPSEMVAPPPGEEEEEEAAAAAAADTGGEEETPALQIDQDELEEAVALSMSPAYSEVSKMLESADPEELALGTVLDDRSDPAPVADREGEDASAYH